MYIYISCLDRYTPCKVEVVSKLTALMLLLKLAIHVNFCLFLLFIFELLIIFEPGVNLLIYGYSVHTLI